MKKLATTAILTTAMAMAVSMGTYAEENSFKVAFLCKDYTDTFCLSVRDEFEKAAKEYEDLVVDYYDSEGTASTQNDLIETCTASDYDAIVFQQVEMCIRDRMYPERCFFRSRILSNAYAYREQQ